MNKGLVFAILLLPSIFHPGIREASLTVHASSADPAVQSLVDDLSSQQAGVFLDGYYETLYFSNLRQNFSLNSHGTCAYVAFEMLLGFYDTYWDDRFIPENYDKNARYSSLENAGSGIYTPSITVDSPGVEMADYAEISALNKDQYKTYLANNVETDFQAKLISESQKVFFNIGFESQLNPFGIQDFGMLLFGNRFLRDLGFTEEEVIVSGQIDGSGDKAREFAIERIQDGIPTIIFCQSDELGGHAMVAYDYDALNDEIYVHPGWMNPDGTALTHVSLSQLGMEEVVDAFILDVDFPHAHTDNYVSSMSDNGYCACTYALPQQISSDNAATTNYLPTYKWKSLVNEKWVLPFLNPRFKVSLLNANGQIILAKETSSTSLELADDEWNIVIENKNYDTTTMGYWVRITPNVPTDHNWAAYYVEKRFDYPRQMNTVSFSPNQYGFADAYPTDDDTKRKFDSHEANSVFKFHTRRYRTGYIHNEYIVMSPIRKGINEAWIEYNFDTAISRLDVQLSHWRPYYSEHLDSSNGKAVFEIYGDNDWKPVQDLLDPSFAMPEERANIKTYTFEFEQPIYRMRFYSCYNEVSNDDSNKGRICIGDMTFYPSEYSMPVSTYEVPFEPEKWDKYLPGDQPVHNELLETTNCYEYALDTQLNPANGLAEPIDPGMSGGHELKFADFVSNPQIIYDFVSIDALNFGFHFEKISKNERCADNCYKIALYIDTNDKDYHWYRQNPDGSWSHKIPGTPPSKIDWSKSVIMDPDDCDRTTPNLIHSYNMFVGFYEITPLDIKVA